MQRKDRIARIFKLGTSHGFCPFPQNRPFKPHRQPAHRIETLMAWLGPSVAPGPERDLPTGAHRHFPALEQVNGHLSHKTALWVILAKMVGQFFKSLDISPRLPNIWLPQALRPPGTPPGCSAFWWSCSRSVLAALNSWVST
jgi:hypothetical protein